MIFNVFCPEGGPIMLILLPAFRKLRFLLLAFRKWPGRKELALLILLLAFRKLPWEKEVALLILLGGGYLTGTPG